MMAEYIVLDTRTINLLVALYKAAGKFFDDKDAAMWNRALRKNPPDRIYEAIEKVARKRAGIPPIARVVQELDKQKHKEGEDHPYMHVMVRVKHELEIGDPIEAQRCAFEVPRGQRHKIADLIEQYYRKDVCHDDSRWIALFMGVEEHCNRMRAPYGYYAEVWVDELPWIAAYVLVLETNDWQRPEE